MIAIRIMTDEGENEFSNYFNQLKSDSGYPRPDLSTPPYSEEFCPRVMINETKQFQSKLELAKYLDDFFTQSNLKREDVLGRNGLWTWLAYLWFDQLAPFDNSGNRLIGEMAKYICSSDYRDYYRHFVAGPYMIYSLHGKNNSRIFLYSPVYEHNDFIEQIASRQFLIAHRNLVEAFSILYLDSASGKPKRGAQSRKKPGNIRRFVRIVQQFELTYDLYEMRPEQIIDLLPPEFDAWRRNP